MSGNVERCPKCKIGTCMLIELVVMSAALAGYVDESRYDAPKPADVVIAPAEPAKVEGGVDRQFAAPAGRMHAFRLATEAGTRAGGFRLGRDYFRGLGNLHGWADGDPFYVN